MYHRTLSILLITATFLAAAWHADAAKESDRILSLPGLDFMPSFKMYSGYMTVDAKGGRNLFYWFVESADDPTNDPLVLWMNGGPGCSSLLGLFTEHGPYHVHEDQTLTSNPWSWNRVANIIYLEAPAGVGFSYSEDPAGYVTGDNQTMADNYQFLQQFFAWYPEYSRNEFYIAGESYGGHYVPQLAWTILHSNTSSNVTINLKGFTVGNAWTDDTIDTNSVSPYFYFHALSSLATWQQVQKACAITANDLRQSSHIERRHPFREDHRMELFSRDANCEAALSAQRLEVTYNINQYDIYTPCYPSDVLEGLACMNYTSVITYLNTKSVQAAIHALPHFPWVVCTKRILYDERWRTILPLYPQLMDRLRITIYAGDSTFNVPFNGGEFWIDAFNQSIVSPYQPWLVGDQEAGSIIKYEKINFVTVRYAGHMVPMYQPESAYFFFERYLTGIM